MIFWCVFIIFSILFSISWYKERRAFKNAIFFTIAISMIPLIIITYFDEKLDLGNLIYYFIIGVFLALTIIAFLFISAGIVSLKREGISLAHLTSILFGLIILSTIIFVYYFPDQSNLLTIVISIFLLYIFLSLYLIFTFFSFYIYSVLYRLFPKNLEYDFIIINGAGLIDGNKVSPLLAGRLNKGIDIYNFGNRKATIIVSGGQGADEDTSEAEAMLHYLERHDIEREKIIVEDKSTSTLENMQYSKQIIDEKQLENPRVIFATSDYHVLRTSFIAKQIGLNAEGVGSKTALYYWPNAFIREYVAIIIKYKLYPSLIILFWLIATIISLS